MSDERQTNSQVKHILIFKNIILLNEEAFYGTSFNIYI